MKNIPDNRNMTKCKPISSTDIIKSYDQRFKAIGHLRESDAFYNRVLNFLDLNVDCTLLDIACGEGHLGCLSLGRGLRTYSVDLSSVALSNVKVNAPENQVSIADGQHFPLLPLLQLPLHLLKRSFPGISKYDS